jgi:hypothetical protein
MQGISACPHNQSDTRALRTTSNSRRALTCDTTLYEGERSIMFEHFTIGAPAHRAGSISYDISPRDTSSPSPPSPLSSSDVKQRAQSPATELSSQLDELKPPRDDISSSYIYYSSNPLDSSTNETFLPVDITFGPHFENELSLDPQYEYDTGSEPNSSPSLSTLRVCRRLQRQLNSQLLCTHSQVKAISDLVEEMVSTKYQCNVTTPSVTSPSESDLSHVSMPNGLETDDSILPEPGEDEGFCEGGNGEDEEIDTETLLMSLRRASAPLGIRRDPSVNGAVFAKPRMRRKILRRKRTQTRVEM